MRSLMPVAFPGDHRCGCCAAGGGVAVLIGGAVHTYRGHRGCRGCRGGRSGCVAAIEGQVWHGCPGGSRRCGVPAR